MKLLIINNLAGATGLELVSGDFSNSLMARDFRRKSLRMCCLVPVFDSPGVLRSLGDSLETAIAPARPGYADL